MEAERGKTTNLSADCATTLARARVARSCVELRDTRGRGGKLAGSRERGAVQGFCSGEPGDTLTHFLSNVAPPTRRRNRFSRTTGATGNDPADRNPGRLHRAPRFRNRDDRRHRSSAVEIARVRATLCARYRRPRFSILRVQRQRSARRARRFGGAVTSRL